MKKPEPVKDGPITKALLEAVALRKQLIADGMPPEAADKIVGQGLKAVLSNPRPEGWKFYCEHCRDTGWINVRPSIEEEARLTALYGSPDKAQGYVSKCEPCKWIQMEREKRRKQMGQDFAGGDDDLVQAGQTKKRGFSKFGK
jgi:hypothetical protein